jgi:hypothetical protein
MKYVLAMTLLIASVSGAFADTVCTPDGNGGYRCVHRPNDQCRNSFSNQCMTPATHVQQASCTTVCNPPPCKTCGQVCDTRCQ